MLTLLPVVIETTLDMTSQPRIHYNACAIKVQMETRRRVHSS